MTDQLSEIRGSQPSIEDNGAIAAPAVHLHAGNVWEEVDEVDEATFVEPLALDAPLIKKIVNLFRTPRNLDYKRIQRSLPKGRGRGPEVLAQVAIQLAAMKGKTKQFYPKMLQHFAEVWDAAEKMRFLRGIKDVDPLFTVVNTATHLEVADLDLYLILSENPTCSVAYLAKFPERVPAFMALLDLLFVEPTAAKIEAFKAVDGYSRRRSLHFMRSSTATVLTAIAKTVSKGFMVELPPSMLRRQLEEVVTRIGAWFDSGKLDTVMAVTILSKVISRVAGNIKSVVALLDPFPILRGAVLQLQTGVKLEDLVLPSTDPCPGDAFHAFNSPIIKVLTSFMANQVVARLATVDGVVSAFRYNNDPTFDDTAIGAFGFSAKSWPEVFVLFPQSYPGPAGIVTEALKLKQIGCVNVAQSAQHIGQGFRWVELGGEHAKGRRKVGVAKALEAKGLLFCDRFSSDIFHGEGLDCSFFSPFEPRDVALKHFAAEVRSLCL